MRMSCSSLNRSDKGIGFWIAIYTAIFIANPDHSSSHHHPIAAWVAAVMVILAAGLAASLYCRRRKA